MINCSTINGPPQFWRKEFKSKTKDWMKTRGKPSISMNWCPNIKRLRISTKKLNRKISKWKQKTISKKLRFNICSRTKSLTLTNRMALITETITVLVEVCAETPWLMLNVLNCKRNIIKLKKIFKWIRISIKKLKNCFNFFFSF